MNALVLRNSVWLGKCEPQVTQGGFRCIEHHSRFGALIGIQKSGRERKGFFLAALGFGLTLGSQ